MNIYRQWVTASADRPSISSALAAVKSLARYAAPYGRPCPYTGAKERTRKKGSPISMGKGQEETQTPCQNVGRMNGV